MVRADTFVKQVGILAVAGILVRALGFAYRVPLTALIGDEGNGIYGASYTLYMFFLVVSSAGFPAAISKMVSERMARQEYHNAHEVFRTCLVLVGFLGLLGGSMLFFGANLFMMITEAEDYALYYSIVVLSPLVFIVAIASVFRGYFQGMSIVTPTSVSQLVEQMFNAVFTVVLAIVFLNMSSGDPGWGAVGASSAKGIGAITGLATLIFLYFVCAPSIKRRIRNSADVPRESQRSIAKKAMLTAFPMIVGTAVFSITAIIDATMIIDILTDIGWEEEEALKAFGMMAGKYLPLTTLPVVVSTSIATAAMPSVAASASRGDRRGTNRKINKALRMSILFSIPAAVGIGVMADQILLLLFPSYPEGGELLRIGAVSIVFLSLTQISTGMLHANSYVRIPMYAALIGAVVKVILNFILIPIPNINVVGAIISTVVCYAITASIGLFMLMRKMGRGVGIDWEMFLKPALASVVMGLVCFSVYHIIYFTFVGFMGGLWANAVSLGIAVVLSVVVYVLYISMIGGLSEEELGVMPGGSRINNIINELGIRPAPKAEPIVLKLWEIPPDPPMTIRERIYTQIDLIRDKEHNKRLVRKMLRRILYPNAKRRRKRRRSRRYFKSANITRWTYDS